MSWLRRSWLITAILGALFVFATTNAIFQSQEALHYREIRGAATQLELAAHTLSMIELIEAPPAGVELEEVDAIALLEDMSAFSQTGLTIADQSRAMELTDGLLGNAAVDGQTNRAEVEELLRILHEDAARSQAIGTEAERTAFRYIVVSAFSGIGIVLLVLSAQRRERRLKRSLREQAFTDFLTGLPNRRELSVCLDLAKADMERSKVCTAILYMDLDGFKEINDAGGHATGDEILKVVAQKLSSVQGDDETLVRLGGDEFGVVVRNLSSFDDACTVAERYRNSLASTTGPGDVLHMSIGVAIAGDVGELDELQSQANLAMYEAKKRQGSTISFYEDELGESANSTAALLLALRNADLDDEFSLEYQPIVSIETDEVFFVEALVRWTSPSLGWVGPNDFIPLAERSGEIIRIGDWVIESALRQLAEWQDDPLMKDLSISVNVSIHQFEDDGFVDRLLAAGASVDNIDPSKLIVEVTESSAAGSLVTERLADIQAHGYRVAIDDFGSGYSNLAQLIHTPYDILKVDRELMSSLEKLDENGQHSIDVLSAVGAIARTHGAPVVCEGVEEQYQLQLLLDADISHIQGWLISKSVSPDGLRDFLEQRDSFASAA